MQQFYKDFGFIIGFMIMDLVVQSTFGKKVEKYFLLITLLSMLLFNSEKFIDYLENNFMKTGEIKGSTTHTSSSGVTHGGAGGSFSSTTHTGNSDVAHGGAGGSLNSNGGKF